MSKIHVFAILAITAAQAAEPWIIGDPRRYVALNGMLDVKQLFEGFAEFWKQHGGVICSPVRS